MGSLGEPLRGSLPRVGPWSIDGRRMGGGGRNQLIRTGARRRGGEIGGATATNTTITTEHHGRRSSHGPHRRLHVEGNRWEVFGRPSTEAYA